MKGARQGTERSTGTKATAAERGDSPGPGSRRARSGIEALQASAGNRATVAYLQTVSETRGTLQRQPVSLVDLRRASGAADTVIARDFVPGWDDVLRHLSAKAVEGYQQFVALFGDPAAAKVRDGAKVTTGANTGSYDTSKAESIWSKKWLTPEDFAKKLTAKRDREVKDITSLLVTMNHLCDETDGTNRPGSAGDGTSEWALKWEAIFGEPYKSPAGHVVKLRDYCKVLSEGLAKIAATRSSVADTDTINWGQPPVAQPVKDVLPGVVQRATVRLEKMREGLRVWNDRARRFPNSWNPDGTTKIAPPGARPEANNKLVAGWPKADVNPVTIP